MPWPAVAAAVFGLIGIGAERLASVWPAVEARHRPASWRTLALGVAAGAGAYGLVATSHVSAWATLVHLVMFGLMVGLVATDLEQRRLPHLLLDPLIVVAVGFAVINPALETLAAAAGAAAAVAFLGILAFVIRGGMALGDLYLAVPIGLTLGWPMIWSGLFTAALLAGAVSLFLVVTGRVGLRSYIAFGPYLVAGYVLTLLREGSLLAPSVTSAFGG
ncbi:MAG: prepilin peptidase [Chloroflexi bacterium]|nr:MAG: prepilin peptidase [Chloroflexota bacterium]